MKLFEWCAFGLVCIGVWFISNLDVTGQYLMAVSQVLWLIVGFKEKMGALVLQSLILLGLAIYAITNWTATLTVAV